MVDLATPLQQHLVERHGLRHGAGKAVQQEPVRAGGGGQRLVDDAVDDLVGHQLAGVHQRLGPLAQRGAVGHRLAQDVAGGELRDAEAGREPLRLRAFSRAGWTEEDEVHDHPYTGAGAPDMSRRPRMRGPRGPVKPS